MTDNTREFIRRIVINKRFEYLAMLVILANSVVIGIETYTSSRLIYTINYAFLIIFTIELALRYAACYSRQEFFSNRWNIFDLIIVGAGYIPSSWFGDNGIVIEILRIIRVFRVLRLLRTMEELRLIVTVLLRSLKTLTYNLVVMGIFLYVFAIVGIYLFRLPDMTNATPEMLQALEQLREIAPWPTEMQEEPYANLSEAVFTLVRCMSGDAWSDLRYHLCAASRLGLLDVPEIVITGYHIVWYILAAFLLINIIIGAVISNFENAMHEKRKQQEREEREQQEREARAQQRLAAVATAGSAVDSAAVVAADVVEANASHLEVVIEDEKQVSAPASVPASSSAPTPAPPTPKSTSVTKSSDKQ